MNPVKPLQSSYTTVDEEAAETLNHGPGWYTTQVQPPQKQSPPHTLDRFVHGILELQKQWFGLRNASPVTAFEIRRPNPDELSFQFAAPTKRLDRKIRTQLQNDVPGVKFNPGTTGLPLTSGDSVGGGLLTTGRRDWYPLRTDFDQPPINSLVHTLHRHTMQDTGIIIQILFQPVAGAPLRNWWWTRRAYQRIGYLRKEKEKLWGSRDPTPRERQQADAIERKAGTPRFHTSIRFLVIGSREYTPSRIKELAGAFNIYENLDTGQYLDAVTVTPIREHRLLSFASAVRNREFGGWSRRFQASTEELAALVSLPSHDQTNINFAHP